MDINNLYVDHVPSRYATKMNIHVSNYIGQEERLLDKMHNETIQEGLSHQGRTGTASHLGIRTQCLVGYNPQMLAYPQPEIIDHHLHVH